MTYPQFQPFPPQYAQPAQQPMQQPQYAPVQQPPMQPQYAPVQQPQYAQPMQPAAPQFMQQPPAQPQYAQPMQPGQPVPMMGNPFAQPAMQPPAQPMQQGYAPAQQGYTQPPAANPFAMFTPAPPPGAQAAQPPAQGVAGQPFVAPTQQGAAPAQQAAAGQGGAAAGPNTPDALQAQINDLRSQQAAWHVRTQVTQLANDMGAINPEIVHKLVAEHFRANDAGQLMVASDPRMNPKEALAAFLSANQYLLRPLVPGGGSGAATPAVGGPMQQPVDPRTAQGATAIANNVMASVLGMRPAAPPQQPQYAPQGYAPQYAPQPMQPQFGQPSQAAQFPQFPVR